MTRLVVLVLVGFVVAQGSAAQGVPPTCAAGARILAADLTRSAIQWKGTKFWGLGSHEGTVRLKAGEFCVARGTIAGGVFVADMRSIEVTDIPADDPVPRNRLRDHLLGPDFFHTGAHPEARLVLRVVTSENDRLYRVLGDLTVRGRTHPVEFYARGWTVTDTLVRAEARFSVDRHRYGVSYRGSTIRDDLVDDEFWLELTVVAQGAP